VLTAENPGGDAIARFILTFYPAWTIYFETQRYANVLGTDDVIHRTWVLVAMMTMEGYIGKASAIPLHTEDQWFSDATVRSATAFWLSMRLIHAAIIGIAGVRLSKFRLCLWLWSTHVLVPMFIYLVSRRYAEC